MTLDLNTLDNTTDPAELLKILKAWDDEENTRYRAYHHELEKNALFYLGRQWLEEKSGTDGYVVLTDDDNHFRPVANHTARLCDLKRSQVLGKLIRPKVQPNSDQKADIDASRLGNLLLKAKHAIDNEDELNALGFLHSQVFGTGWRVDYKQPIPHEYIEMPRMEQTKTEFFQCQKCGFIDDVASGNTTCPTCQEDMEFQRDVSEKQELDPETKAPAIDRIPLYRNKVAIVDPFRIKVNACATEDDLYALTDSSIQQVQWIKDAYSVNGEGFAGPEVVGKIKSMQSLPRALKISEDFKNAVTHGHSSINKTLSTSSAQVKNDEQTTILHKSYFKPSKNNRFGRMIVWTHDAIIYDGKPDIPNNKKLRRWHGYTPHRYRKHPLRFEGIPYIEDLIPINKTINALHAMVLEHLDKTASPERYEFDNVQVNNDDSSDGILRIKPMPGLPNGGAPGYLTHPQMSSEVYRMLDAKVAEIEKVGNVTEVVQGLRPAGVDTYRGLQLLRDAADSSEAELYNSWHEYIRKSAQLKLAIIQECLINQDEELTEMMEIIRSNENMGIAEVQSFIGQDLRNNLNVVMEQDDYMSQSTEAQADRVRGLMEAKLITPEELADPYTKILLMRKLGMANMPMPGKDDVEKAERIIELLESGQATRIPKLIKHFDDKPLQIRVLTSWMKTSKFESLPQQVQAAGEQLIAILEQQIQEAQIAAMQQKMAMMNQNPMNMGGGAPMDAPMQ